MLSAPQKQYIRRIIHQLIDYNAIIEKAPYAYITFRKRINEERQKVKDMIETGQYGII